MLNNNNILEKKHSRKQDTANTIAIPLHSLSTQWIIAKNTRAIKKWISAVTELKNMNPKNIYTYHVKEMMFVSGFKRNLIKFCVCMSLFLFAILLSLLPYIITQRNHINQRSLRFPTDLKYILFWRQPKYKNPFRKDYFNELENGQKSFIDQKCPHINCYISYNKSFLGDDVNNFDAVVFDVRDISKFKNNDFNFTRAPHQQYIFRAHESAEKQPVCNPVFDDYFTWTWTYKLDSEIPHPFVSIYNIDNELVGPSKEMQWVKAMNHSDSTRSKIERKKKGVAWIVTRCRLKNKHRDFVRELRKELVGYNYSVDVYGPCGDYKCPSGSISKCYKMVENDYYFQMVLEDSFAEDYVGENIVKALGYLSVPIVLGGADYTR